MTQIDSPILGHSRETDRLFRGGFVAAPRSEFDTPGTPSTEAVRSQVQRLVDGWRFQRIEVGGYSILVAPDTPMLRLTAQNHDILVIGDLFDNDGDDPKARLTAMAKAPDLLHAIAEMDLGGRHAVLIVKGDDLVIFNDPFGSRSVHYFTDGRRTVASHAGLLAQLFDIPPAPDVAAYTASAQYKTRSVKYLPGNLTAYQDIRRLIPNHVYSTRHGTMARYWPHLPRTEITDEDVVWRRFDNALDALRLHVAAHYDPVVGFTGGIDSRVICTNFHTNNQPFTGVTWLDWNYKDEERATIDQLAAVTGQPSHGVVRSKTDEAKLYRQLGAYNAGNLPGIGGRIEVMKQLEKLLAPGRPPVFIFGYGGEIIRGFYRTGRRDDQLGFTKQDMLDLFGVSTRTVPANRAVSNFVMRSFQDFYKDGQFGSNFLKGFDANDIFYWEHRMAMWAAFTLETIDPVMHCLVGMNSRRMFEAALSLPNAQRLSKEFLRRYIAARSPELAAIPVI